MLLGSFGASAVLIFGAPAAPFSQPRNVVGGHIVSASAGVTAAMLLPTPFAAPVGVALATSLMAATRTVHPPAGGTALIAVLGSARIHAMGPMLLVPTALGSVLLVGTGVLWNRLIGRKYPA